MKTFLIYSFCKINLSLRVIEKLRTKLHKIQSIVTFVNLFDIIKIKEINSEQDQIKFHGKFKHNINLERSIEMLEVAFNKKREDPYIIDSLGWGMYLTGRYEEAEKLLQKAVELMPLDPIVNDHYADILWKLNKNLQASYFWNYVLSLKTTENEMKDRIKEKLILGIQNHS